MLCVEVEGKANKVPVYLKRRVLKTFSPKNANALRGAMNMV